MTTSPAPPTVFELRRNGVPVLRRKSITHKPGTPARPARFATREAAELWAPDFNADEIVERKETT